MKTIIIVVVVLLAVILILSCIIADFLYRMAISRKGVRQKEKPVTKVWQEYNQIRKDSTEWFLAQNPQILHITSYDGLKLMGYYLPVEDAVRTVIMVHGFRSGALNEFAPMTQFFHEQRCNLLLVQQRAHGESEGNYLCFGVKERFDVREWISFYNEQFGSTLPIYLYGVSMGCGTVVMASGLELPSNVCGVIADCGYTSPWDEFKFVLNHDFHLPTFPILYIADFLCRVRAGFAMKEVSTLDIVKKANYPMLFIHGTKDDFVPTFMGQQNYDCCTGKKQLLLVEGAGHALSWKMGTEQYKEKILQFFAENR